MTSAPVAGQLMLRVPFEFEEDVEVTPKEPPGPPGSLDWLEGVLDHLEQILGGPRPLVEWFEQPAASIHLCGYELGGFYRKGDSAIWVNANRRIPHLVAQTVAHEYLHYRRWHDVIVCPHRGLDAPDPCEDEIDDQAWDLVPGHLLPTPTTSWE